ncbi:hypothetical protein BH24ACT5_BH24ACT5_05410 [soil metagenome]
MSSSGATSGTPTDALNDNGVVPRLITVPVNRPAFKVGILGLGYVGLPASLAFAAAGHGVTGIDISSGRIACIERGDVDVLDTDRQRLRDALSVEDLQLFDRPDPPRRR